MAAVKYDFRVEAGSGLTIVFAQTDLSTAPVPFEEGTTAEFQARVTPRAPEAIVQLTETPGDPDHGTIVVDEEEGTVTLHLTDEGTRLFDSPNFDSAVYAIEIYEPGKDTRRLAEGRITCSPEIVRPAE